MPRFYVIDQNVLRRKDEAFFRLLKHDSVHFVFIDTALVELVKPENWDRNLHAGFARFRDIPHRCHMSVSVHEAVQREMKEGRPAHRMLLPQAFTTILREIIASTAAERISTELRDRISSVRDELMQHDLNPEAAKREVERYVDFLQANLPRNHIAACRQGALGRGVRAVIANRAGRDAYYAYARKLEIPYATAAALRRQGCLTWRWLSLRIHHALQWLGDGGLQPAGADTVLRDLLDQDYVLLASFFDGILSKETAVNTAFEDLQWILSGGRALWPGRSKER